LNSQALPYVVLLGLLWGSNLVVARFTLGQFNPILFVGLRLLLASFGHVLVYTFSRQRPWPTDRIMWRHAAWLGVLGTAVPMTTIIIALQYQSSGVTSVFITTAPAVTVLLAHFLLPDESLTWRKSAGIALALGGAMLLVLRGESGLAHVGRASPLGFGLVTLSIISGSIMSIYARKHLRHFDGFDVATIRMFVATMAVMPILFFVGFDFSRVNWQGALALVYTAVFGAFAGLVLEFYIIKRFGPTAAAMTAYVIPIAATFGGAIFLDERITAVMLAGMALIILGIAIINRRYRPERAQEIMP
jgi:drug/metabolite transporter (DMT)-like permease